MNGGHRMALGELAPIRTRPEYPEDCLYEFQRIRTLKHSLTQEIGHLLESGKGANNPHNNLHETIYTKPNLPQVRCTFR